MGQVGVAVYCSACGLRLVEGSGFCSSCGTATEPEPHAAQVPPSTADSHQDIRGDEPPTEGAVPVDSDIVSPGGHRSRVWLISGAAVVVVLLVVGAVFVLGRGSSNTATGAGGTLPVASPQDESGTDAGTPDVAGQGTADDSGSASGGEDERTPGGEPTTTTITSTTTTTAVVESDLDLDNLQWTRVPDDDAVFGGTDWQRMESVVAAGPGLVAVGWDGSSENMDAAVWWSTDGFTWNRVPDNGAVFGGPDSQRMESVVAAGPGLVAVGSDGASGDKTAAVWWSVDGLTWSQVPNDRTMFGPGDQRMNSVVATGPGLVAVGTVGAAGGSDAAVWWSVDGLIWNRIPNDEAVFGGPSVQSMESVVAGGPGLVAVGSDGANQEADAATWWSVDGLTWNRVRDDEALFGGPGNQLMSSVVAGGPGLVAVGLDGALGDADAAVWWSVDGLTWNRVPEDEALFGGLGQQWMWSVVAAGPGLVAVGYDPSGGDYNAGVWWSVDGLTWNRVPNDDGAFGGPNDQFMNSVVWAGPGLVAVGSSWSGGDADAAVWVAGQVPGSVDATTTTAFPWLITPNSVGPVTLGAQATDLEGLLESLTGMPWIVGGGGDGVGQSCVVFALDGHWVYAVAVNGIVEDISLSERGIALTEEGSQVGDDRDSVLQRYSDRASVTEGEYYPEVIIVDGPVGYSYVFNLDNDGLVISISIGTRSPQSEGGCS